MWQARRWSWIDPDKDISSSEKAVRLGVTSRTRIAAEQGVDIEDTFAELADENSKAQRLGIDVSGSTAAANAKGKDDAEKPNQDKVD
jgi:capsid protein